MVKSENGLKPEFNETYLREKIKPVTEGCELTFENLFNLDQLMLSRNIGK